MILLLLAMLGALFLFYSRVNEHALPLFVAAFFLLVLQTFKDRKAFGLLAAAGLASLTLALRFRYLTWGDPWYEYAMILKILEHGSLSRELYPSQQPGMHLSIAGLTMLTKLDAMALQKFIPPLFSAFSAVILYKFVKNYFRDKELGLLAGLLLLVGTPYLHWVTQGVRESMGLPMLLMAFYFSYKAVKNPKPANLLVSLVLITGLALTHNFSAAVFIAAWLGFSLAYVYLHRAGAALPSLLITLFAIAAPMTWWSATGGPSSDFANALKLLLPGNPMITLVVFASMLYALPLLVPGLTGELRRSLKEFFEERFVKALLILIASGSAALAVNLVLGKSFLVLNYPAPMMFNGAAMILLGIIGLYFMNPRGIPVLAWAVTIALPFLLSILRIISFGDPLRFMEYLYIPLAIIAGAGLKHGLTRVPRRELRAGTAAALATISLITAFPAAALWGTSFEKGSILYDDRSWVIYHPDSEVKAIRWLDQREIRGTLYSDNYVYYAAQWVDGVFLENRERLRPIRRQGNNYFILTERMREYAEFSEGMMRERRPLQESEIENLDNGASLIYDAGEAKVYYTVR